MTEAIDVLTLSDEVVVPRLMNLKEVTAALRCSRTQTYNLIAAGSIPRGTVAGKKVCLARDVKAYIRKCLETSGSGAAAAEANEAFRYDDAGKRKRRAFSASSDQEADAVVDRMNAELIGGGALTVGSCFAIYKFDKQQKNAWTQSMERAMDRVCAQIGTMAPAEITVVLCEKMIEARRSAGLSADTVRIEMAYLRAAVRHCVKLKRISRDDEPFIKVPPGGAPRERWLTPDEIDRLIEGAVELHVKLFIIIAVTTAARPSHILQLLWKRVDLEHRVIDYRGDVETRKRRPRVPINDTCLQHLLVARELARSEHVIEFRGEGDIKKIWKGVSEAARRAGLAGVSPYVLRHTAGVWMAKAGVPMEKIASYMGHDRLETTIRHYAHYHPAFMQDAAAALEIRRPNGPRQLRSNVDPARER